LMRLTACTKQMRLCHREKETQTQAIMPGLVRDKPGDDGR